MANGCLQNNSCAVKCGKYARDGLVYLGSKRSIAEYVYHAIKNTLENAGVNKNGRFVDAFCGGGAMGLCALAHGDRVVFNDKQSHLIYLLQTALTKRSKDIDVVYQNLKKHFTTREEYFNLREIVGNKSFFEVDRETSLRYAFAACFFSFAAMFGKSYIYGKNIEEHKHNLHDLIFFKNENARNKLERHFNIKIVLPENEKPYNRYLAFAKILQEHKQRFCLQHLQHLERLERLEHLEHLEDRVIFSSVDYTRINFEDGDIIYCDPPYYDTAPYLHGINHDDFFEWSLSIDHSVFISEYQDLTKRGFVKVFEKEKRVLLNNTTRLVNNKVERLYWNGK